MGQCPREHVRAICTYLLHSLVCADEILGKRDIDFQSPVYNRRMLFLGKDTFGRQSLPCDLIINGFEDEPLHPRLTG